MHLDLFDDEAAALIQELHDIVESARYPFSPRIRTLRAVLNNLCRRRRCMHRRGPSKVGAAAVR
jgi:hypothetical protein